MLPNPSVFVCYAHGDGAVVLPHIDWLESQHVALWFDRGIQGGAIWRNGPFWRCQAHRGLGEYDEAMKWLRRAVDELNLPLLEYIRLPNVFQEMRDHPDFAELLQHLDSIEVSH